MPALDDSHGDAMRDALALIECSHNGDLMGGRAVLDNANLRLTAAALARITANILEDWTNDPDAALRLAARVARW